MTGELRRVTFTLPVVTPTVNDIRKMHFGTYKKLRESFAWMVRGALNKEGYFPQHPMPRAIVTIERHSCGEPDTDNAVGGVKVLCDCLVQPSARHPNVLGVVVDDHPAFLTLIVICIRVHSLTEQCTVVKLEEQLPLTSREMKRRPGKNCSRQGQRTKARAAKASAIHQKYLP
jgi:hypothetical protein